jgi:hypothetical protein
MFPTHSAQFFELTLYNSLLVANLLCIFVRHKSFHFSY